MNAKLHAVCDGQGQPLILLLSEGHARSKRHELERMRDKASARIQNLTLALADGAKAFTEIRGMVEAQIQEGDRCDLPLKDLDAEPVLLLHPGIADTYRSNIEALGKRSPVRHLRSPKRATHCAI